MSSIKQSETVTIKRSEINFAPYNPKVHSKESIAKQKRNFKEVGFLGGIVWNETTGNLVSGHKRIMAMDEHFKYDATPETDYDVKVEKIELSEKQEKEQNIFMDAQAANTKQDYSLLSLMLPDIDYKAAGLEDSDLNMMTIVSPTFTFGDTSEIYEDINQMSSSLNERSEAEKEARKQHVKDVKQIQRDNVSDKFEGDSYVTISFSNYANKVYFMELFGYGIDDKFIK
jgi:hypothetical protein